MALRDIQAQIPGLVNASLYGKRELEHMVKLRILKRDYLRSSMWASECNVRGLLRRQREM